jgi:hypothetical protein
VFYLQNNGYLMDMDEIYGPGATLIGGQIQLG